MCPASLGQMVCLQLPSWASTPTSTSSTHTSPQCRHMRTRCVRSMSCSHSAALLPSQTVMLTHPPARIELLLKCLQSREEDMRTMQEQAKMLLGAEAADSKGIYQPLLKSHIPPADYSQWPDHAAADLRHIARSAVCSPSVNHIHHEIMHHSKVWFLLSAQFQCITHRPELFSCSAHCALCTR